MAEKSSPKNLARVLTVWLGAFWLLDGILQLQPAMFTKAFVDDVLTPNLQGQPSIISNIVTFGIHIWNINPVVNNFASAFIQVLIGLLLILPLRKETQRFGLWLSVAWGLIVWIFGEGFGGIATGMATFYNGAPGSALLYVILAIALLYSLEKKLPTAAGILFILCALLNFAPMFWQGTLIYNLFAIDLLLCIGCFLILTPNRPVAWVAILFLATVWCVSQSFGGLLTFPGGIATDPNSAPLFALFLLPIFFRIQGKDI